MASLVLLVSLFSIPLPHSHRPSCPAKMPATLPTSTEAPPTNTRASLPRTLRERDLFLLFIGSVIGSGLFLTPRPILRPPNRSAGYSLLVLILRGLLSLPAALTHPGIAAPHPARSRPSRL